MTSDLISYLVVGDPSQGLHLPGKRQHNPKLKIVNYFLSRGFGSFLSGWTGDVSTAMEMIVYNVEKAKTKHAATQ